MRALVKRILVAKNKRIIAISDIHGNLNLFIKLLDKINYTENDVLILVGDITKKGDNSLETLRYIMQLSKKREVYVVTGNCDTIWEYIESETDDENLLRYMLFRKNSFTNEMCKELSIEVNEKADIRCIKEQIRQNFRYELDWLEQLPHIIETKDYIFVHAGISSDNLEKQEINEVICRDAFMNEGRAFSKYVIVGHWPTANYGKEKCCCNPIINEEQKIICIDGGNVIKSERQLNALIINGGNFTFEAVDDFPTGKIIEEQASNSDTIQILWMDNAIEVLEKGEEFSLCIHKSSKHKLWIKNDIIFEAKDGMHCYDCTDYFIPVKKGDIVSIIEKTSKRTLVKKDGIIGWVENKKLMLND